ncbi:HPr family phosphocarrier protein [Salmonella enterica subsp. enterica serovar Derby]|nr:hypothetical protein [Salmonella enterica subsp. enterica serovar Derby]EGR8349845.1 hypothetical protein [Salmonella enterica]EEO4358583.1 hypothetical protein [Salmonella enterica subsp. enterica serovar Derby]EEW9703819.1 hypothetical protein [Salmonella enterica subsp. enterica serovar Derby]EHE6820671.1 hypothetical protein [Salmonella enterica subsp. enterica serovar Derby]
MIRENIRVVNSTGLHARPAATFIKTLKKYESSVTLINNGKETRMSAMKTCGNLKLKKKMMF